MHWAGAASPERQSDGSGGDAPQHLHLSLNLHLSLKKGTTACNLRKGVRAILFGGRPSRPDKVRQNSFCHLSVLLCITDYQAFLDLELLTKPFGIQVIAGHTGVDSVHVPAAK
jgi:hypothetical protein